MYDDDVFVVGISKVILERKLAVLEKALAASHNNEQILAEYLTVAGELLPLQELFQKWSDAIERNPNSWRLWKQVSITLPCTVHTHTHTRTYIHIIINIT